MNFTDFINTARKICDGEYTACRHDCTIQGDTVHHSYKVWVARANRWTLPTSSPDEAIKALEELHNNPSSGDPVEDSVP